METKIPILCKVKNKLVEKHILWRSPSAMLVCEYGFRYRSYKCENCPKHISIGRYLKIPPY